MLLDTHLIIVSLPLQAEVADALVAVPLRGSEVSILSEDDVALFEIPRCEHPSPGSFLCDSGRVAARGRRNSLLKQAARDNSIGSHSRIVLFTDNMSTRCDQAG